MTSSFRISEELHARLKALARELNQKQNWVIVRAIEEFVERHEKRRLQSEARRQSLLVSAQNDPDSDWWEKMPADDRGWS